MSIAPTDSEIIRGAIGAAMNEVFTASIAEIVSYDDEKQNAYVQPVMQRGYNVQGLSDFEDYPVLPNVPVVFFQGGGFFMTTPLAAGDYVVLVFLHEDISNWRSTGAKSSSPDDLRRMSLASCVAIAGIHHDASVLSGAPLDLSARKNGLVLGKDGTPMLLCWTDSGIVGGRPDASTKRVSFVALADRTEARLEALETQLTTLSAQVIALTAATSAAISGAVTASAAALGTHTHLYTAPSGPLQTAAPTQSPPDAPSPAPPPPPAFVPEPLPVAADILQGTGPLP